MWWRGSGAVGKFCGSLREHANSIVALVATHGHEDHVGGIQFLLRDDDGIGHLTHIAGALCGVAFVALAWKVVEGGGGEDGAENARAPSG